MTKSTILNKEIFNESKDILIDISFIKIIIK